MRVKQEGTYRCLPIHFSIVLSTRCILSAQLHSCEHAFLIGDCANKLDGTMHAAGYVDNIANTNVPPIRAHPACGWGCAPDQCV
jgi:hypothetical protein